jgi:uncharacterized protein (TIGR00251 family)
MWFKIQNQQVTILIFAKPHAQKTTLLKITDEGLHIALHAKPHEGEANKELISYLAKLFGIPKSHITLHRGKGSRHKIIMVPLCKKIEAFLLNPFIKQ